jgi:transforming growth factor-beta-induced protein
MLTKTKKIQTLIASTIMVFAMGCATKGSPTDKSKSIAEIASETPGLSTLVTALQSAGLVETFSGEGNFTVFAPTNEAFAALPAGVLGALLADQEALTKILTYHALASKVVSGDLVSGKNFARTMQGANAVVLVEDSTVTVNKAAVVTADIMANNGVIHVINQVILPPETLFDLAYTSENHTTLVAAVEAASLESALNGDDKLTVFAPTNTAFAALPSGVLESLLADIPALTKILTTHVVGGAISSSDIQDGRSWATTLSDASLAIEKGDTVTIYGENSVRVTTADLAATNGYIHVVDSVILPPSSIAALARSTSDLSVLTGALESTGLYEALADSDKSFTVFAPRNAAFQPLIDDGTIASLTQEQLSEILLFHVIDSVVLSSDIEGTVNAETLLEGAKLSVSADDSGVQVNGTVNVVQADIRASNGVVHVVDGVLLPPREF